MTDENDLKISDNSDDIVIEDAEEAENPAVLIKRLREKLKKCEADKQEYLAGWQRAKADFINARKEEQEARAGIGRRARGSSTR